MDDGNALGEYLRARRELVAPGDVGIRVTGVRRVAGLRREEVAMLAGVSADYYLRLEQGRDRNPSAPVLTALAKVLQLDEAATGYLLALTQERPARGLRPRPETVPPGIRNLLDVLQQPAFVEGRFLDVLAANPLATALSPTFAAGQNRLRDFFLAPAERTLHTYWDRAAAGLVAGFRASAGTDTDDPRFVELVGELTESSESFRRLWARHDVRLRQGGLAPIRHPELGDLLLRREKLAIGETEGQLLVVFHAERGSEAERMLAVLGSLAAASASASASASTAP